jgi:acetyl-CoA acetyltransferase family protein
MRRVVIVDAVRTPVGRQLGALKTVRVDDLAAVALRAVLRRTGFDPGELEDVVLGTVDAAGEACGNLGRYAALLAGIPESVAGSTVNRFCGSGLTAVNACVHAIAAGSGDAMIGGGAESMSRSVWVLPKPESGLARGNMALVDAYMSGSGGPAHPVLAQRQATIDMPATAQNLADRFAISREEADAFAYQSQQRYATAKREGRFDAEIEPVQVPQPKGDAVCVRDDEHPRPDTSLERLATLKPAWPHVKDITAGNSSGVNDGASAVLLVEEERAAVMGVRSLARVLSTAVAGVDPKVMGLGPALAIPKALRRAGLALANMELIEINEAFAAQVLACLKELDLDQERVNVNGGAIAMGHALGNSGSRVLTTLVHELRRRGARYGVASLCIGGGQGIATVVENLGAS